MGNVPVQSNMEPLRASNWNGARPVNRREFLRYAALSTGALATGGSILASGCEGSPTLPEPSTRNRLRLPAELGAHCDLVASSSAALELGDGRLAPAWGYNHAVPGPTVRVRRGESVDILLRNSLPQETTVHWHGLVVPHDMDGHPLDAVWPGGTYAYRYPIVQRAGMHWYHPHPHHHTGEQVFRGLAGALIIEDEEEGALGLPSGPRELPLILRDAELDGSGGLRYRHRRSGVQGDFPLVNGVPYASYDSDAALYRLRVLNGTNARVFRLALSTGEPLVVIGNDGGLLEASAQATRIDLGPAERLDLLLDLRRAEPERRLALRCLRAGWDLLEFVITGPGRDADGRIPQQLATIPSLSTADVGAERDFSFEGHSRINGREYDMHRVDFQVPLGETELWRFRSDGSAPHPIHVHGTHFQVISRSGGRGRVFPWERGWKDTVLLQDGETVEVLTRFERYKGLYLLHCHKLEHEEAGMMLNFEVT